MGDAFVCRPSGELRFPDALSLFAFSVCFQIGADAVCVQKELDDLNPFAAAPRDEEEEDEHDEKEPQQKEEDYHEKAEVSADEGDVSGTDAGIVEDDVVAFDELDALRVPNGSSVLIAHVLRLDSVFHLRA